MIFQQYSTVIAIRWGFLETRSIVHLVTHKVGLCLAGALVVPLDLSVCLYVCVAVCVHCLASLDTPTRSRKPSRIQPQGTIVYTVG